MLKRKKKTVRKTVKRKAAPKRKAKPAGRKIRATKKVTPDVPNLVKGKFVVMYEGPELPPRTSLSEASDQTEIRSFLDNADIFTTHNDTVRLFDSKESAQKAIDDLLVLAEESAMIRKAKIFKAADYFETSYEFRGNFDGDTDPEASLSAVLLYRYSPFAATTFNQARRDVHNTFNDLIKRSKLAIKKAEQLQAKFTKVWG